MLFKNRSIHEPEYDLPRVITRAQAGDHAAFDVLYQNYAHKILQYLYLRTQETENAQDLTQEVFLRVLKHIQGFEYRGEKSFLAWLYTIAGNVLLGQNRRKVNQQTPLDASLDLADPRSMEHVSNVFERAFLMSAMSQLTNEQQQVLTLKFFGDFTNQEIALAIGRSEGAVKALQHRALLSLQQILEREAHDAASSAPMPIWPHPQSDDGSHDQP